jgi:hypothetical protein
VITGFSLTAVIILMVVAGYSVCLGCSCLLYLSEELRLRKEKRRKLHKVFAAPDDKVIDTQQPIDPTYTLNSPTNVFRRMLTFEEKQKV